MMRVYNSSTAMTIPLHTYGAADEHLVIPRKELDDIALYAEQRLDAFKLPQSYRTNALVFFWREGSSIESSTRGRTQVHLRLRRRADKTWEITHASTEVVHVRTRKRFFMLLTKRQRVEVAKRALKSVFKNTGVYAL